MSTSTANNSSQGNYPLTSESQQNISSCELESWMQVLQHKINTNDPQVKCIKYPNLLMSSLVELNYLVGMDRLKDSIALQVMRLIDGINKGEKSTKMLNTILYGPPGVGKTKVGIILAKIWFALGYLQKPVKNLPAQPRQQIPAGIPTEVLAPGTTTIIEQNPGVNPLLIFLLLIMVYLFSYIVSGVSYVYDKIGLKWMLILFVSIFFIILILYYNKRTNTYFTNIITVPVPSTDTVVNDAKPYELNDRDIISVVSRQHFVAEYVGQTAPKTKALLQANLGKVLLIDEAYSLINGERDQFGMEALTELNLFLGEHPDGIAVIFAGYKDLLKYGIFRIQPGLPRRCMWHFECEGYTGDQLCDIFIRQVYNDGYAITKNDYEPIRKLINDNKDMFKSYGGDTERLLFFSQLEASRYNMMSTSNNSGCDTTKSGSTTTSRSSRGSSSRSSRSSRGSKGPFKSGFSGLSGLSGSLSKSTRSSRSSRSKPSQSKDNKDIGLGSGLPNNGKILTYQHVQYGLRRLGENNIDT